MVDFSSFIKISKNCFIINMQIVLIFLSLIIFKYSYLQSDFPKQVFLIFFSLVMLLVFLIIIYNDQKSIKFDLFLIFSDIALITMIIITSDLVYSEILFLIPIMLVAMEFSTFFAIMLPIILAVHNTFLEYLKYRAPISFAYIIETGIILILFILVSWLISSIFKAKIALKNELQISQKNLLNKKSLVNDIIQFMPIGLLAVDFDYRFQLEKINLMGQIATGIALEIERPLSFIKSSFFKAQINKDFLNQDNLNLLIKEIDNCNAIISNFLSLARKDNKKKEILNMKKIILELSPIIIQSARLNEVEYQQDLGEVPDALLNKNEIKQLVLNLCHNALEAMDGGGVLTIRLCSVNNIIRFTIEDTGVGISEELLGKIVRPFFTTKTSGTGLGLSICTRIIQNHGGLSSIESKLGKGTKVAVCLPSISSNTLTRDEFYA